MCRESVLRRVLGYGCDHLGDTPRFLDSYCYYYDENSNTKDYALTAAQAEQVYAALMQDVQDSDNGGSDIFAVQEYQYDPPPSGSSCTLSPPMKKAARRCIRSAPM